MQRSERSGATRDCELPTFTGEEPSGTLLNLHMRPENGVGLSCAGNRKIIVLGAVVMARTAQPCFMRAEPCVLFKRASRGRSRVYCSTAHYAVVMARTVQPRSVRVKPFALRKHVSCGEAKHAIDRISVRLPERLRARISLLRIRCGSAHKTIVVNRL